MTQKILPLGGKMHIVLINPFDKLPWESNRRYRYSMLAGELALRGHQVSWITSDFFHTTKQYRKQPLSDESHDVRAVFVHVPPYYRNVSLRRVISHRAYARGVLRALKSVHDSEPIHLVLAVIPPTESARVAMEFCAEKGVIGLVDMQDPWPKDFESFFPRLGRKFLSRLLLGSFRQDVKIAANLASGLVAISPESLDYLASFRNHQNSVKQASFILGFDSQAVQISEKKQSNTASPIIASYIGTFGYSYDLETVVRSAVICASRNIQFILIGDGPTYNSVKKLAEDLGLKNVTFTGHIPFDNALPMLLESDIGLVPYVAAFPPNTVNKTFEYLFLGLPVVSSLRGKFEKDLQEFNLGLQYEAGNPNSLAKALLHLDENRNLLHEMRERGLEYAIKHMDGKKIYEKYAEFIEAFLVA